MDFKKLMNSEEYDFLRTNERLGNRIMLLGLGGSYAYGTNNENSDIDFRGVTLQMPSDLLGFTEFEQYEDDKTDTVIYGFNKLVKLLSDLKRDIKKHNETAHAHKDHTKCKNTAHLLRYGCKYEISRYYRYLFRHTLTQSASKPSAAAYGK
jgi:predicted nucleotidyltransferase